MGAIKIQHCAVATAIALACLVELNFSTLDSGCSNSLGTWSNQLNILLWCSN